MNGAPLDFMTAQVSLMTCTYFGLIAPADGGYDTSMNSKFWGTVTPISSLLLCKRSYSLPTALAKYGVYLSLYHDPNGSLPTQTQEIDDAFGLSCATIMAARSPPVAMFWIPSFGIPTATFRPLVDTDCQKFGSVVLENNLTRPTGSLAIWATPVAKLIGFD